MSSKRDGPPAFSRLLLLLVAPSQEREAIDGDLCERYRYDIHFRDISVEKATRNYRSEVAWSVWPLLVSRIAHARASRLVLTVLLTVFAMSSMSFWLGVALSRAFSGATADFRLLLHVGAIIAMTPAAGFLATRGAGVGSLVAPIAVAIGLVAPAIATTGGPAVGLRLAWILLIPLFTVVGGIAANRSKATAHV